MKNLRERRTKTELSTDLGESLTGERLLTDLTGEAGRMPGCVHGSDDPAQYELRAGGAAGSEEDLEVVSAVTSSSSLEELSVWEGSQTLRW